MREYYHILGVALTASKDDVKRAYKRLAQIHHPDKGGNVETFKRLKHAYDWILKNHGTYQPEPEPKKTYTTWGSNDHVYTHAEPPKIYEVKIDFSQIFGNGRAEVVPDSGYFVKVPYGVRNGEVLHKQLALTDRGDKLNCSIRYTIEDPTGHYSVRDFNGVQCLFCQIHVTTGMMLSGFEFSMRNINPQIGSFTVKASPTERLLKVPHVGLPSRTGRGALFVEQVVEVKALEDEIYPVLKKLQERVAELLSQKNYNQAVK